MQFMRRIAVVLGKQTESSSLKKSEEKKKIGDVAQTSENGNSRHADNNELVCLELVKV